MFSYGTICGWEWIHSDICASHHYAIQKSSDVAWAIRQYQLLPRRIVSDCQWKIRTCESVLCIDIVLTNSHILWIVIIEPNVVFSVNAVALVGFPADPDGYCKTRVQVAVVRQCHISATIIEKLTVSNQMQCPVGVVIVPLDTGVVSIATRIIGIPVEWIVGDKPVCQKRL